MTSYKVTYQKRAEKWLKENKAYGIRFFKAFTDISQDIKSNFVKYDIKRLKDNTDFFRLRIGKYRAVFTIINDEFVIMVVDIDSRGGIYK